MARSSTSIQTDQISSCMDGVNVKIAEAYKPPRKVTLPAAYNNKLPDISRHHYDFSLEKSVLIKLSEWRRARQMQSETRRARLEERKRRDEERKELSTSPVDSGNIPLPTKVPPAPETTILTPQPLSPPLGDLHDIDLNVKSNGLNYADFDNDTSSPFDNMELKTINDMEELAQVLQPTSQWIPSERIESILKELTLDTRPENDAEEIVKEVTHKTDDRNDLNTQNDLTNQRNISIIVGELQQELTRPHVDQNWKSWPDLESPDSLGNQLSSNNSSDFMLPNLLSELKEDDKKLAKHLNDMGFPLSRAARAINYLGGKDNKKVVEYLLAIQYLEELGIAGDDAEKYLELNEYDQEKAKKYYENLCTLKDLGFSEDEASKALLKFNIDRDKALDFLCA